jgi:hypothetical protein
MNNLQPPKYIWDCGLTIDNIYKANNQTLRIGKINNAYVNDKGVILFGDNDIAANGGKHYKSRQPFQPSEYQVDNIKQSAAYHQNIISVASRWQPEYWHFVIENLPGILLTQKFSKYNDYKIHLGRSNSAVEEWLSIVGIDLNRIVIGNIKCKYLFIPELAMNGTRAKLHLELLKENLDHVECKNTKSNTLIYSKRTKTRTFHNSDEIQCRLKKFADDNSLVFCIHDDSCLSSVEEQLSIFKSARIVVAQHGAGCINMCVARQGALLIELFDKSYVNNCNKPWVSALKLSHVEVICDSYIVPWAELEKILKRFTHGLGLLNG